MKIIFEENDLIMRAIIAKKNKSELDDPNKIEKDDKIGVLGWFVGFKTKTDELYEGATIISVLFNKNEESYYGRYFGDVSCEGGIPNIPSAKGISLLLGDEQRISPRIFKVYSNMPEVIAREDAIRGILPF